jgi:sensor histidine kinase YesM
MPGDSTLRADRGDDRYVRRVIHAFDRRRIAAVILVTLLLSVGPLSGVDLGFFSPPEIVLLWLEQFGELAVLAAALTIAYTLLDESMPQQPRAVRLAVSCCMLFGLSVALTVLLYGYYAHGFGHLFVSSRLLADSLRLALPAMFLVLIADVHRRALQIDSAAHAAEMSRAQLGHDEAGQQLALLQAQIEPHFLFNVLGNVRRLYRTQPRAGSEAIVSLMRYLCAALPQLRKHTTSLAGEIELVRAYLDLLKVRMGPRLAFSIEVDRTLDDLAFPPMLLITLVENAIKHGLDPVGGGSILVGAYAQSDRLQVSILDDGVGLGAAASSGAGVGLANIRRQLAARYDGQARLTLQERVPRGTRATISIPIPRRRSGTELESRVRPVQ